MAYSAMASTASTATASTAINTMAFTSNYQFDVFLNHCGCDTKNNFAGHLYSRLRSRAIRVFLDKEEMRDELTDQIKAAIKTVSVHLAIFSEKYAESKRCLDELVLMVESGAIIIPVFFKNVEPFHLRWRVSQTGSQTRGTEQTRNQADNNPQKPQFAEGFWKLQNMKDNGQPRHGVNTIGKWTDALSRVSYRSGFELAACHGYEAELIEKIVQSVLEKVNKSPFYVPKYEVGLDEEVEKFRKKVKVWSQERQNEKAQVVGIVGLGGIGKTTLVKEFFLTESPAYRQSYFYPVSRNGRIEPPDSLFRELFKCLSGLDPSPTSVDAVKILQDASNPSVDIIENNPSLVVLDGVENVESRENLLKIQEVLHSKSLILITSRDKEVLSCSEVEKIYTLDGLNEPCSRKLFCLHAFHEAAPLQGYEYLVACFSRECHRLPLLLKVMGALLCGNNDRFYWEDLLYSFHAKNILYSSEAKRIEEKLKFIYDKLGTEEQRIFLDIAGFSVRESTDNALKKWKGLALKGIWFQILLEKRLVEVDSENCIQMHDLLKRLGGEIAEETKSPRPLFFGLISRFFGLISRKNPM